jgi:hypothetical protein
MILGGRERKPVPAKNLLKTYTVDQCKALDPVQTGHVPAALDQMKAAGKDFQQIVTETGRNTAAQRMDLPHCQVPSLPQHTQLRSGENKLLLDSAYRCSLPFHGGLSSGVSPNDKRSAHQLLHMLIAKVEGLCQ